MTLLVVIILLFVCGAMLPGEMREAVSERFMLGRVDGHAHVFFCALIALLSGLSGLSVPWIFIWVMVLGGLIEFVQLWIPYRSSSWKDVFDNAFGTSVGLLMLWLGKPPTN